MSGTSPSAQPGATVLKVIVPVQLPAALDGMQVIRASSQYAQPLVCASWSEVQAQLAEHAPVAASQYSPAAQSASEAQVSGTHDDRATSQWKPSAHWLSLVQNPASSQMPCALQ